MPRNTGSSWPSTCRSSNRSSAATVDSLAMPWLPRSALIRRLKLVAAVSSSSAPSPKRNRLSSAHPSSTSVWRLRATAACTMSRRALRMACSTEMMRSSSDNSLLRAALRRRSTIRVWASSSSPSTDFTTSMALFRQVVRLSATGNRSLCSILDRCVHFSRVDPLPAGPLHQRLHLGAFTPGRGTIFGRGIAAPGRHTVGACTVDVASGAACGFQGGNDLAVAEPVVDDPGRELGEVAVTAFGPPFQFPAHGPHTVAVDPAQQLGVADLFRAVQRLLQSAPDVGHRGLLWA